MLRSSREDLAKLLARLPKHQNLIISLFLTAGLSLGSGLLLGQLIAEGKLGKTSSQSYQKLISKIPVANVASKSISPALLGVSSPKSKFININTATILELDSLPGIGLTYAQKIISGRPYLAVIDLVVKKIIPLSSYNKIKDQISVQ